MNYINYYQSKIGHMIMASNGTELTGLWFENQKYFPKDLYDNFAEKNLPVFEETKKWLDIYFSQKIPDFTPKLNLIGSEFRKEVWNILLTIPYGTTMTYKEISNIIAYNRNTVKMSAQAIGGAVGHNPISIIIPCHRIIGSNGSLTGYAGGIDKKEMLLKIEKIII